MRDDLSPLALRQALLAGLPIPVAVKTLPDRKVALWNQAAEAFLGIPARDLLLTTGYHLFEAEAAADGFSEPLLARGWAKRRPIG